MVSKTPVKPKTPVKMMPYDAFLDAFIERIFRPELYKVLANMSDRKENVTMQTLFTAFRQTTGTTASIATFRMWMRKAGIELEQTFRIVIPDIPAGGERDPETPAPRVPRGVAVTGSLVPGLGGLVEQD